MLLKKMILTAAAMALPLSSYAQNATPNNTGWFIGGFLGQENSKIGNSFKNTDASYGVYGGYNFTSWFGLESSFFVTSENSILEDESGKTTGSFGGLSVTPKFSFPINDTITLYVKAGLTSVVYTVEYEYDGEYFRYTDYARDVIWSGVGTTIGLGVDVKIVNGLKLRISHDRSTASLESDESYLDYNVDAKLTQTALGLHYQF